MLLYKLVQGSQCCIGAVGLDKNVVVVKGGNDVGTDVVLGAFGVLMIG